MRRVLVGICILGALLTAGVAVQQCIRVARVASNPAEGPVNDFDRWMIMTRQFVHEHADYVDDYLPTPPLTLVAFAPFAEMPRPVAQFVFACLKLPFAWLVLFLATRMVTRAGVRLTSSAWLLIVAGFFLPFVLDIQEGQVNFLALLPLVAGLSLAQREQMRSDVLAGVLISLGAAVKVTPIVFVAYFLWRRRTIVALSALVSLPIWLFVVPALAFGWDQNMRWMGQWMSIMILPYAASARVAYANSQSVGSFALRLFTAAPAFEVHRGDVFEYGYMNVAALDAKTVNGIVRALMVAVAGAGLVWMRRPLSTLRSTRYVLEVGAVAAFMLWFSERTWVHHYVSFALTLAAAGMIVSNAAVPEKARRRVAAAVIAFSVLCLFTSEAGRLFGRHGIQWAKAIGVVLWPSVLVVAATLYAGSDHGETDPADVRAVR